MFIFLKKANHKLQPANTKLILWLKKKKKSVYHITKTITF